MKTVICAACSDRHPRVIDSLLLCDGIEECVLLAQVEPGCLETWGSLVSAGFDCAMNQQHLDVNRNMRAVLARARKTQSSHVVVVGDWCVLPEDAITRLVTTADGAFVASLYSPGFTLGQTPLAWAVTGETLNSVLAHWCTREKRDYARQMRRRLQEARGVEVMCY
jgi:hypothetical protein